MHTGISLKLEGFESLGLAQSSAMPRCANLQCPLPEPQPQVPMETSSTASTRGLLPTAFKPSYAWSLSPLPLNTLWYVMLYLAKQPCGSSSLATHVRPPVPEPHNRRLSSTWTGLNTRKTKKRVGQYIKPSVELTVYYRNRIRSISGIKLPQKCRLLAGTSSALYIKALCARCYRYYEHLIVKA
jgi:hypothetical protein